MLLPSPAWFCTHCCVHNRRVFVVSEADLVAYRRKVFLASVAVVAALVAVSSVLLVECFADGACGVGYVKGKGGSTLSNGFVAGGGSTVDLGGGGSGGNLFSDKNDASLFGDGAFAAGGGSGGSGVHGDLYEERTSLLTLTNVDVDEEPLTGSAVTTIAAAAVPVDADALTARNGTSHRRDCNTEWCYSRSLMGLWEWLLLLLEAGFCIALRHDLAPATAGVGVESFVL